MREVHIAGIVSSRLTEDSWEVYPEVQLKASGGVADLVAIRNGLSHVVECKRYLSLDILAQALRWVNTSSLVSVAVPRTKTTAGKRLAVHICRAHGVGVLEVSSGRLESLLPAVNRYLPNGSPWVEWVSDKHRVAVSGRNHGPRYTAWDATCDALRDFVEGVTVIPLSTAVSKIQHHYKDDKSACRSLSMCLVRGDIEGLSCSKNSRGKWVVQKTST